MKIRLRDNSVEIEGYVNAVGRDSRKMVDEDGYAFREQIQPGVFAKALRDKADQGKTIPMYLNHDHNRVLGDTSTNLELEEDNIGLHARATITDPEVVQKAAEGKLSGWSFGFIRLDYKDEYTEEGHRVIVTDMSLEEVTLVDDTRIPAYAGTSVHVTEDGKEERILTRTMSDAIYVEREEPEHKPEKKEPEPDPNLNHEYYELINQLRHSM